MEHSSGIIVYRINEKNIVEFFVCTPDGPYWKNRELWNFPKGYIEKDETPFQAALREFEEETSVSLDNSPSSYEYLGKVKQNTSKNVHVFLKKYNNEDFSNCFSNECVTIIKGKEYVHREIKEYRWMTYEELKEKGIKAYNEIFNCINNDKHN